MLYTDKGKATIFKGDREPIARFEGDKQVAGFVLNEKVGNGSVAWESPYKAVIPDVEVFGDGKQEKLEGKNLIPFPYMEKSKVENGVTYAVLEDGAILISGTAESYTSFSINDVKIKKNTVYTFGKIANGKNLVLVCNFYDIDKKYVDNITKDTSLTFNTKDYPTAEYVRLQIKRNGNNRITEGIFYPQLEQGTQATPYEPYCGGIPAPNPNYPIEPTWGGDRLLEVSTPHQEIQVPVLRAIGDYKDTYNPQKGEITRRIKELILTGDEKFIINVYFFRNYGINLYQLEMIGKIRPTASIGTSNNFICYGLWSEGMLNKENCFNVLNNDIIFKTDGKQSLEEFKAFLKQKYTEGNPVKIWYVLATPQIEKVSTPPLIQDWSGEIRYDGDIRATVYEEFKG